MFRALRHRVLLPFAALALAVSLGGCVAYPAYPTYAGGYGGGYYAAPYYSGGVVAYGGGWRGHGWRGRHWRGHHW